MTRIGMTLLGSAALVAACGSGQVGGTADANMGIDGNGEVDADSDAHTDATSDAHVDAASTAVLEPPVGGSSGGTGGGAANGEPRTTPGGAAYWLLVPASYRDGVANALMIVFSGTEGGAQMTSNIAQTTNFTGLGDLIFAVLDGVVTYGDGGAGASVLDDVRTRYSATARAMPRLAPVCLQHRSRAPNSCVRDRDRPLPPADDTFIATFGAGDPGSYAISSASDRLKSP